MLWIIRRFNARRKLRALPPEQREVALAMAADCCHNAATAEDCELLAKNKLESDPPVGFGVVEILAVIQVLIAIWKFIDSMGWLDRANRPMLEKELL
ncbi:MAG: hypothetical protein CMK32_09975 [Porticoccaceae bacterium]|nr:hypothetical protein [Porticoccaceae bacterium]